MSYKEQQTLNTDKLKFMGKVLDHKKTYIERYFASKGDLTRLPRDTEVIHAEFPYSCTGVRVVCRYNHDPKCTQIAAMHIEPEMNTTRSCGVELKTVQICTVARLSWSRCFDEHIMTWINIQCYHLQHNVVYMYMFNFSPFTIWGFLPYINTPFT